MKPGRRLVAAIGTAVLLLGGPVLPASAADDFLVVSDPEPRSELSQEPGWVTLVFESEAGATYAAIVVHNSRGENVTTGPLVVEGTNVTSQLISGLPQDTYTVIYRTEDTEGQPRGGAFQFAYGPGRWVDVDDQWIGEEEQPPEIDNPGPAATPSPEVSTSAPVEPSPSSPSGTPSAPSTTEPSPQATPSPAPVGRDSNLTPWLIGIVAVLVVGGGVWIMRRRSAKPPGGGAAG